MAIETPKYSVLRKNKNIEIRQYSEYIQAEVEVNSSNYRSAIEKGFNPIRFLFNCFEEPIDVIKHDLLYSVKFNGNKIRFFSDIDKFVEELATFFPSQSYIDNYEE